VFLATKVDTDSLAHDDVLPESTEESLDKLGTDYLDLLYVHWPTNTYDAEGTLSAFDKLFDQGKIRHVGVSNFEPRHLDEARERLDAPLFAHQIEDAPVSPADGTARIRRRARSPRRRLLAAGPDEGPRRRGPAGHRRETRRDDPQVTLAWFLALDNVTAIPKATSEEHIRSNWGAYDVELDDGDMDQIAGLDEGHREVDFDGAPWNQ